MYKESAHPFGTIVFGWFTNHVGGLEQLIVNRTRWFVSQGIDVVIVTTDGPMTPKYQAAGARVHALSRYENDFRCLGAAGLARFIRQVLSAGLGTSACLVGFDKKSLWFLNELAKHLPAGGVRLAVEHVALKIFYDFTHDELSALGADQRIICMNEASRLYLEKVHQVRLPASSVIPLPVPATVTSAVATLDEKQPVVVSACRLEEMKEYVFGLIQGAAIFFERHPGGRLLIIGDGSYRVELEKVAAPYGDKIRFLGTVDPADYADTIRQGAVFVGMGLASVQAAQLGLPVVLATAYDICFSSPGTLSEQAPGDFGEEIASKPREGWTVVMSLLADRGAWQSEGEACRRHAQEFFGYEKNMATYHAALSGLSPGILELAPPSLPSGPAWRRFGKKFLILLGLR